MWSHLIQLFSLKIVFMFLSVEKSGEKSVSGIKSVGVLATWGQQTELLLSALFFFYMKQVCS